jgi:hypothetical protein
VDTEYKLLKRKHESMSQTAATIRPVEHVSFALMQERKNELRDILAMAQAQASKLRHQVGVLEQVGLI